MRHYKTFAIFAFASYALSQVPTKLPVTGNLGSILGAPSPYATVELDLYNCSAPVTVTGFAGIVETSATIQADSSGNVNSTVWPNDEITCNGTIGQSTYGVTYIVNGVPSGSVQCYGILSTQGLWNLNAPSTPVPCGTTPPSPTNGTYGNLTSTSFLQANNGMYSGSLTVTGGVVGAASQNLLKSGDTMTGKLTWNFLGTAIADTASSGARTFLNPEFSWTITDNGSPATSNSGAIGDLRSTPATHVEVTDAGPNDAEPFYGLHTCGWASGSPASNGACVGMMIGAQTGPTDQHYGVEAINGYCNLASTAPSQQMQCFEANAFNNSGLDSQLLSNGTYTSGPMFGISSTAGGSNKMIAAFNVQDEGGGSGWQYGLLVGRATGAGVLITSGAAYGIVNGPSGVATSTANFDSVQNIFQDAFWNGTANQTAGVNEYLHPLPGTNPNHCRRYLFSNAYYFDFCDDGSIKENGVNLIDNTRSAFLGALTASGAVSLTGIKAASATMCLQIDSSGSVTNTGLACEQTLTQTLTTTANPTDSVTLSGMTAGGHCAAPAPTNSSAATAASVAWVSAKASGSITVSHASTAGMTYDIACWNH